MLDMKCDCPVLSKIKDGARVRFRVRSWKLTTFARLRVAGKSVEEATKAVGGYVPEPLWEGGMVERVWFCLDEWCADVITDDGGRVGIIPAIGDEIEVIV